MNFFWPGWFVLIPWITVPKVCKDWFICLASSSLIPELVVLLTLSDPAKSTNTSLAWTCSTWPASSLYLVWYTSICKIVCDLLEVSFIFWAPIILYFIPAFINTIAYSVDWIGTSVNFSTKISPSVSSLIYKFLPS